MRTENLLICEPWRSFLRELLTQGWSNGALWWAIKDRNWVWYDLVTNSPGKVNYLPNWSDLSKSNFRAYSITQCNTLNIVFCRLHFYTRHRWVLLASSTHANADMLVRIGGQRFPHEISDLRKGKFSFALAGCFQSFGLNFSIPSWNKSAFSLTLPLWREKKDVADGDGIS